MDVLEENHDIIKKAYKNIYINLDKANLSDNEKHAMGLLIEKLMVYYDKRLNLITRKKTNINSINDKTIILESLMTDILVDINNVIKGEIDVYYFISIINKRLNDKDIENIIKSKRK